MFISRKRSNILFIIILILNSCGTFISTEPVGKVNEKFKANYGSLLNKSKKNYYNNLKKENYSGETSFEKTAMGRIIKRQNDFIEINARNNPYIEIQTSGNEKIEYLSYNAKPYMRTEENIFDSIEIPKNEFKYYNLGSKMYNEINNIELQESYDYIEVINKERLKQIEITRLREVYLNSQNKKDEGLINKTKKGLQNLANKIKGLLD